MQYAKFYSWRLWKKQNSFHKCMLLSLDADMTSFYTLVLYLTTGNA